MPIPRMQRNILAPVDEVMLSATTGSNHPKSASNTPTSFMLFPSFVETESIYLCELYRFDLVEAGRRDEQQTCSYNGEDHAEAATAVQTRHEGCEANQSGSQIYSLL